MQLTVDAFLYLLFKLTPGFSLLCGFILMENYDGAVSCCPGNISHRSPEPHQEIKTYIE